MKVILAVLAFVALAQAEANLFRIPKVVGGDETQPHQYPFMAALSIDEKYFCGGTILSENMILTAAHCCKKASSDISIKVVVGGHNIETLEGTEESFSSKLREYHEGEDACVVTLDGDITTDPASKAFVKLHDDDNLENKEVTVVGWGRSSDSSSTINPTLSHAKDKVISNEDCKRFYDDVKDSTVCLNGNNGRGACLGDFGGPLIINNNNVNEQVGIASFGSSWGCSIGFPSAFVRISTIRPWINNILNPSQPETSQLKHSSQTY